MYNRDLHHRRSIRLPGYDYSRDGAYFVTICVQHRESLFGEIVGSEMAPTDAGRMVQAVWDGLAARILGIQTPAFVLMPNHVHGIIVLGMRGGNGTEQATGAGTEGAGTEGAGTETCPYSGGANDVGAALRGRPVRVDGTVSRVTLADVIYTFKSWTTTQYRQGVYNDGWRPFSGKLWQRNYYERVIRNDRELNAIHTYILDNPANWPDDAENPRNLR